MADFYQVTYERITPGKTPHEDYHTAFVMADSFDDAAAITKERVFCLEWERIVVKAVAVLDDHVTIILP